MINMGNISELEELMTMSFEDIMDRVMKDADSVTERKIVVVLAMFHDMFHSLGWGKDCSNFTRMLAVALYLGRSITVNGRGGGGALSPHALFTKESLKYVMSPQAATPTETFDALPRDERVGYEELCRFAFQQRIRDTLLDNQMVTEQTLFSAAMDVVMYLHQMQTHILQAQSLNNIVVFDNDET